MSTPERLTQNRIITLFREELRYRYLGHCKDRAGNSNIEEEILTTHLQRRGVSPAEISGALDQLRIAADVRQVGLQEANRSNQQLEFNAWFFATSQLVFAGNDSGGLRYEVILTPAKYFLTWKEDEADDSRPRLDKYLIRICRKERLIGLLRDFVAFLQQLSERGRARALQAGPPQAMSRPHWRLRTCACLPWLMPPQSPPSAPRSGSLPAGSPLRRSWWPPSSPCWRRAPRESSFRPSLPGCQSGAAHPGHAPAGFSPALLVAALPRPRGSGSSPERAARPFTCCGRRCISGEKARWSRPLRPLGLTRAGAGRRAPVVMPPAAASRPWLAAAG